MANTIVQYTHFATAQALALHLHPLSGGAKVNAAANMAQPDAVNDPLLYDLTVPENAAGWHRGIVYPQAGGTPYFIGQVYLNDDAGSYPLEQRAAPPVTVDAFTAAAKLSLGSVSVAFQAPAWNADLRAFDRPIVRGDDYLGNLALVIPVTNFGGRSLLAAASIVLTGRQIVKSGEPADAISWTGSAADAGGGAINLVFEPTSADTDAVPGNYNFDVQCTWSAPAEIVTVVVPGARLEIAEDLSP